MSRQDRLLCTWPECGRTYYKACKLAEHMRSHTNTRPYECRVEGCGKTFMRNGHLQRHHLITHSAEPKPLSCSHEGCEKRFSLKHQLKRHEKLHTDPFPFKCEKDITNCEAKFNRRIQLRRHEEKIHNSPCNVREKIYVCGMDGCTVTFTKWSLLVDHRKDKHTILKKHHDDNHPPSPCPECGKVFSKTASLRMHILRTHVGLKNESINRVTCTNKDCQGRVFSSENSLKAHISAVHEKLKPYKCEICNRSFGYKCLLVRHHCGHGVIKPPTLAIRTIEEPSKSPKSTESPFFGRLTGLEYSLKRKLECPELNCHRRFFREYDLERHLVSSHSMDSLKIDKMIIWESPDLSIAATPATVT